MGISVADCRAGTIVWVQRKNGSWWPGRVVGPNELSVSHDVSIRNGTPVKLLGKEDASVNWYNLEKSKRIKAFRCGEFDDCIERAESSQVCPSMKRMKYAHRGDAILHALELEKQEVIKKHKRPGEEIQVAVCRAKRSRCVHLPAGENTSSRSTRFKFFASDSLNREKAESATQVTDRHDGQTGIVNCKEHDELGYLSNLPPEDLTASGVGSQKRNVKRKLKIQNLIKRSGVVTGRHTYLNFKTGTHDREDPVDSDRSYKNHRTEFATKSLEELVLEVNLPSQSALRIPDRQQFGSLDNGNRNSVEAMLIDIELTVQACYRGEHVPLVSLMSRLNGWAIIGHPIEIETLEDSSSEMLVHKKDVGCKLFDSDGTKVHQSVWRTSRRTPVSYLPPPHDKPVQAYENSGQLSTRTRGNSYQFTQELLQKPLKKHSLSNQITRTHLFAAEQKYRVNGGDLKPASQRCMKDRLLKPGEITATRVTCVPVELVFSRLQVAVVGFQP